MVVNRRRSIAVVANDSKLLPLISDLKSEHPFWGYRRIRATLKYKHGMAVNHKRVHRILREHNLLVNRKEYKAKRTSTRSKPCGTRPNEYWGIDMTKIMTGSGWAYLVIVLDWYTKKIVGYDCGVQSRSNNWLSALDMGLNAQFPDGVRGKGLHLVSDNGCQPTSTRFSDECIRLNIKQIFTAYSNPKGNADTERMFRTIKEELIWINEFKDAWELKNAVTLWVHSYNNDYLHSALGWKTPTQFEQKTRLIAA